MKTPLRCSLGLLTLTATLFAAPPPNAGYVAHEWGTFTSVQGADGNQLEWNPLTVSELPGFVYNLANAAGRERTGALRFLSAKTGFVKRQRMETPVIYFYAKQPQTVDVDVRFPEGVVTEWFPSARPLAKLANGGEPVRDRIAWDQVRILPKESSPLLPADSSGSHYFAARGAEANPLTVRSAGGQSEVEKFLFYRGVGNFRAPLTVTTGEEARELTLKNAGQEAFGRLFVLQLRDGNGAFQEVATLKPGETRTVRLAAERTTLPTAELRTQLRTRVKAALVDEGLFPAEAAAMVATWDDSWFAESGLRVLYTLPNAWVDRVLPMKLTPAPQQIARVFVGRAEVLTPAMEFSLLRQMLHYSDGDAAARNAAVQAVRAMGLGRFAEPAVRRVLAAVPPNREFSNRAWELLETVSKPEPKSTHAGLSPQLPEVLQSSSLSAALGAAHPSCGEPVAASSN